MGRNKGTTSLPGVIMKGWQDPLLPHRPWSVPLPRRRKTPSDAPIVPLRERATKFVVWTARQRDTSCFGDVSKSITQGLRDLGFAVREVCGPTPPQDGQIIILGANGLKEDQRRRVPSNAIIYQLEQPGSRWMTESYLRLLRTHIVWDFSPYNVTKLRSWGCPRVYLCRIGSNSNSDNSSSHISNNNKSIDVLFYGSRNERRTQVVNALRARGVKVHDRDIWGEERRTLVAQSKIVLNIHYYPDAVLEMVRLGPLLEQGAFIVSETGADPEMESVLSGGIVFSSYDTIVDTVVAQLARSAAERDSIAVRGTEVFGAISQKGELSRCLSESGFSRPRTSLITSRVKCYINNRDRFTWTKNIVREIVRLGGEPIIIDNASTYPPLLSWYQSCDCRVVRLGDNVGARAPWISGTLERELSDGELYVATDPDLDLSRVPDDALSVLVRGLDKYDVRKAGLSLEINDVPQALLSTQQINGKTLFQIESAYWKERLDHQFWQAPVDMTFALYRHNTAKMGWAAMDKSFPSGVRADRPYTARHLPWYRTESDLDEEDRYYATHRKLTVVNGVVVNGTWYDSIKKAAAK